MGRITTEDVQRFFGTQDVLMEFVNEARIIQGDGSHRVCELKNGEIIPTGQMCFSFWQHCDKCVNCVSKKAADAVRSMVKLEYMDENYFFVMARPFQWKGEPYILELITNITTSMTTDYSCAERGNFVQDVMNQLERISEREGFTGLYNKAYLERNLTQRLTACRETGEPLYLAMFDIDKFKAINDVYGHVQGDAVLLKFSEIVRRALRKSGGYAARFGGDEFTVVFGQQSPTECEEILRRVKREFDQNRFEVAEMSFSVTASYGAAEVSGAASAAEAIAQADAELYRAKTCVKNTL